MKLGVLAKTFAGTTPAAVLASARRAGYETVQYSMTCSGLSSLPLTISGEIADAVSAASSETGVTIDAVSATYNMIHPSQSEREKGRRAFQSIASVAHRMGTRLLTVCTGTYDQDNLWKFHPNNASAAAWEEMCGEFRLLLAIAQEHDILIGVEPELSNVISSAERARKLLDTFGDDRIRIVFDAANLFDVATPERQKSLIGNALDLLAEATIIAHAKDRRLNGDFTAAGTGVLDYRYYLTALRKSGFSGSLIAHGMPSSEAESVALFLRGQMATMEAGE